MPVSFGMGIHSSRRSFPRKRESTRQTFGNTLSTDWIPAFAGMTGGSRVAPTSLFMSATPAGAYIQTNVCATRPLIH